MIIRDMTLDNLDKYVSLCNDFLVDINAHGKGFTSDSHSIRTTLGDEIERQDNLTIEITEGEDIIGLAIVVVVRSILNFSHIKASEMIWHTDPYISKRQRVKAMKLMLERIEGWAKINKASSIHISCPIENDIHKFLGKRGYKAIEYNLVKGRL